MKDAWRKWPKVSPQVAILGGVVLVLGGLYCLAFLD